MRGLVSRETNDSGISANDVKLKDRILPSVLDCSSYYAPLLQLARILSDNRHLTMTLVAVDDESVI